MNISAISTLRPSILSVIALGAIAAACSSDGSSNGDTSGGSPALPSGGATTSGGATAVGGSAGALVGAGGLASGGRSSPSGGAAPGGGATSSSGGASVGGAGGSSSSMGGAASGKGGAANTSGGQLNGAGGASGGKAGGTGSGGSGAGGSAGKTFSQCRFHFGTIDSKAKNNPALIQQLDMFTPGWIGQSDSFDMKYLCDEAASPFAGVVPAMVSYIIAFTARRDQGLEDCNVSGDKNLCKYGATYIRAHRDRILSQYAMYAKGFAGACGTTKPLIWLMEPDYYQYSVGGDAQALTAKEAGELMTQMVSAVRQNLPNAVFSMDLSPWMPNNGRDWYANFNMMDFTFINTSGGGTDANNARIRSNNDMTWAGVHQVTGKPILADTGYGAAGSSAGHDANWDVVANINARIADGVMSISQYNPNSNWGSTIQQIRPQLSSQVPCP